VSALASISSSLITFTSCEKVFNVYNRNVSPYKKLDEVTLDELREDQPYTLSDGPTKWAVSSHTADTVIIEINKIAQTAFALYADVTATAATLSGSTEPAFPESYHDILIEGVLMNELKRSEKLALAQDAKREYEQRLSDLKLWMALSPNRDLYQNKLHSSGFSGSGGGSGSGASVNGALSYTQTGLITFDRDPSAPFAVTASSAVVPNLIAESLSGGTVAATTGVFTGSISSTYFGVSAYFSASGVGGNIVAIRNSLANAASYSQLRLGNNSSDSIGLISVLSSTFSGGVYDIASGLTINSTGTGGLNLAASAAAPIRFYSNATLGLILASNGLLQFAGTTSAFPALRRTSTSLEVVLADASAYAPLVCSTISTTGTATIASLLFNTTNGIISTGGTGFLQFISNSDMYFDIDSNNDGTNLWYWRNGTGGSAATLTEAGQLALGSNLILPAVASIYLDGGGDTYIQENTANDLRIVTGGTLSAQFTATGISIPGLISTAGIVLSSTGVAIPAGGSTTARVGLTSTTTFGVYAGSGAPSVSAAKGSLYPRSDGSSTTTRAYINTDGGTTWTAITTVA